MKGPRLWKGTADKEVSHSEKASFGIVLAKEMMNMWTLLRTTLPSLDLRLSQDVSVSLGEEDVYFTSFPHFFLNLSLQIYDYISTHLQSCVWCLGPDTLLVPHVEECHVSRAMDLRAPCMWYLNLLFRVPAKWMASLNTSRDEQIAIMWGSPPWKALTVLYCTFHPFLFGPYRGHSPCVLGSPVHQGSLSPGHSLSSQLFLIWKTEAT